MLEILNGINLMFSFMYNDFYFATNLATFGMNNEAA
jgi:hypothetical protein